MLHWRSDLLYCLFYTDNQTDIVTYRHNRPRGQLAENFALLVWEIEQEVDGQARVQEEGLLLEVHDRGPRAGVCRY